MKEHFNMEVNGELIIRICLKWPKTAVAKLLANIYYTSFVKDFYCFSTLCLQFLSNQERLNQCEQNTVTATQKTYDLSSEIRGYLSTLTVLRWVLSVTVKLSYIYIHK